jgi:FMN-dependent oxidoreductase (nitrilotriacetate monooxygenase family)
LDILPALPRPLERGKFDAFFMADHLALLNMPMNALKRSATTTSFDPLTLLPALAVVTERLGLIATASTTFNDPYHIARKFASLDHISNGRAGWNLVTTSNPEAARNFGLDEHVEHGARYRKAREFYDIVTGLWDSWADDAFIRDVESGIYFDPERMHVLNHQGPHFSVRGPLNIARPSKAGRSSSRRERRRQGGKSPRKPPRWFSPPAAQWPTPSASTPTSRAAWRRSAATGIN